MNFRKYILLIILSLCSVLYGDVKVALSATKVLVNEPFELQITSQGSKVSIENFPEMEHLKLLSKTPQSQRQNTYIVNGQGKTTYVEGYPLVITQKGKYTIPSITVVADGKQIKTPPLQVEALEASERKLDEDLTLADATFGEVKIASSRRDFFIGEEIPLEIEVFTLNGVAELRTYPEVDIPKVVFRDYSKVNRDSNRFAPLQNPTLDIVKGRRYQRFVFNTQFRSLAPNTLDINATYTVGIREKQPQNRRMSIFDDDFFGRSNMKNFKINCTASPQIKILPLPTAPENMTFIGAIGDSNITYALSNTANVAVGDVITLKINLSGNFTKETLNIPRLKLNAMRAYPAEIKTPQNNTTTITYSIIPLRPGANEIKVNFAVFNPISQKYESFPFEAGLEVKPSERAISTVSTDETEKESTESDDITPENNLKDNHILYIKTSLGVEQSTKLSEKSLWITLLIFLIGPAIFITTWWLRKRTAKRNANPNYLRHEQAKRNLNKVIAKINGAKDASQLDQVLSNDVVSLLSDALNLPPGSTGSDVAQKVDNPMLKTALNELKFNSYMPGSTSKSESMNHRQEIIRAIKRLIIIMISLLSISVSGNNLEMAIKAYDQGDFSKSQELFTTIKGSYPNIIYNRGLCYFMQQDYANALLFFERAYRLEPRNPAILEGLNLTRQKLNLPMTGLINSPRDLFIFLRSAFTPNEWMFIVAILWSLTFIIFTWRKFLGTQIIIVCGSGLCIGMVLGIISYITLLAGPYSNDIAITLNSGATLRSLPSKLGIEEGIIPAGYEVKIIDNRGEYTLIGFDNLNGWTKSSNIKGINP